MSTRWSKLVRVPTILLSVLCLLTLLVSAQVAPSAGATRQNPTTPGNTLANTLVRTTQTPHTTPDIAPFTGHDLTFEHLSVDDGLASNLAQAVLQDSQGFLWFGTLEGLSKYDGYEMTVYRPEPDNPHSLSDTVINGLYEDSTGNLWIATANGLNKFDPQMETFTRYLHDPDDPDSVASDAFSVVDGFYEDEDGYLWFSTWAGGLNKFDPQSETFTRYRHDPDDPDSLISDAIIKMVPAPDGNTLWLATPLGLAVFDLASETFTHYQHDPTNPNSLSDSEVNSVHVTTLEEQPVIWAGTGDGQLNQIDPLRETIIHHTVGQTKITEIYEAADGVLWLGTQGEGIFLFDPVRGSVVAHYHNEPGNSGSLGADLVNHIYADQTGRLWIASYTGGISLLDPHKKPFRLYRHQPAQPNSLSSSDIYTLDLDQDGILWVGTLDSGLNRFDPQTETFTRYLHDPDDPNSLSHNIVTNVLADSRGLIWIATVGGGLNKFDPQTETFTHYRHDASNDKSLLSDGILDLFEDSDGMLWLGMADTGLSRFDPQTETFTHYVPDPSQAGTVSDASNSAIFEDSQGRIWIGGKQGLDRFDPQTEQFTNYRHDDDDPHSLSHNYIKAIIEDDDGYLWLTTDVGLNRFDPQTEQFRHYLTRDGLPHNQTSSIIAADDGYLWVGTAGGLSRFDPRTETFRNYNAHDGLQGDVFSPYAAARSSDGILYFGGINGLNAFDPDELDENPYAPPVALTEFQLFNEPVTPGGDESPLSQSINLADAITLDHEQSVFGFEFVALNYTAPENNQYAYKLEGFDHDWTFTDSSRRFARYTNLDPGRYTFRVKASNNDGVWNETGASVAIIVTPPWWETGWFRSLVLVLIVGSVLGGFQWRVWSMQQRERWLTAQVDARTRELQASEAALRQAKQAAEAANQAKSAFLANMSHELRTPLNTIQGYADILRNHAAPEHHLHDSLQIIQRSSDHLLALIDEVLDIARIEAERIELHPAPFHLPEFVNEIVGIVQPRAERKGLVFSAPTATERDALPTMLIGDTHRLRQILLNLLTNAIKCTEQSSVTFRVECIASPEPLIRFQVEDTGIGIAEHDLERIFEPFQQVQQEHHHVEGVGLGLTISRRLVQMMGGNLYVHSTPGAGSCFWFDLPLPEATEAARTQHDQQRIIGVQGRQPRVLVLDDNDDNRAVLVKQLEPLGFELAEADNAAEGLTRAAVFKPEAIITDRMMPGNDGTELILQLRQIPTLQHTVIIVSSASVFPEDRQKSLAAGGDDFLPKPVKREQLLEMLQQHLHLEWRYADGDKQTDTPAATLQPVVAIPPQEALQHLYQLTLIGHTTAIQEYVAELARSDEHLAPFAANVEGMAHRIQISELCAYLEQYLEP